MSRNVAFHVVCLLLMLLQESMEGFETCLHCFVIEVLKVRFLGLDNSCGTVYCLFLPADSLERNSVVSLDRKIFCLAVS